MRANRFNSVGAQAEVRSFINDWSIVKINDKMLAYNIKFFNPSECGHWGGLCERMIRSNRHILRGISSVEVMIDETLYTICLKQTE